MSKITCHESAALSEIYARLSQDPVTCALIGQDTGLVPGSGNTRAQIVMVGEAPGAREEATGVPFSGAAGKFLSELLSRINISRDDLYITNLVKFRPAGNRDPRPAEIAAFLPYLREEIAVIKPRLVALLGRHATSAFFPGAMIGQLHGQLQYLGKQAYLPLYHPAAALHNGSLRQAILDDFIKISAIMNQLP